MCIIANNQLQQDLKTISDPQNLKILKNLDLLIKLLYIQN